MMTRSPKLRHAFVFFGLALAACGDEGGGGGVDSAAGDTDARDSVILPDTVVSEVADTVEDLQPEVIVPGEFGAPCNTNADCDSGYCVDGPKGFVCTRTCDTTCPDGYDCKAVSGGTDVVFLCLPRLKENCAPCAQNFQCAGGACLQLDGQGRCAYTCTTDEECPDGFACDPNDQAPGPSFCQPTTGSCSCYEGADGGLRSCTTSSELGVCTGVQECSPDTGWSACSAGVPKPEECNGEDDDCDGVWDDNLAGAGGPCVNSVEGVGECQGVQICLGVSGWLCVGPSPNVEQCNAIDDDCDGDADEDFKDAAGLYASEENCGGCGVGCAGKIPDATALCSTAGATPRCEVETCDAGYYQAGPLTCLPIADFSCVPCLTDAHCTTPGDRCLPLDGGNFCGRDCAAGNAHDTPAGECPAGYSCEDLAASEGAGVRQCVPDSGSCTCLAGDDGEQRPCTRMKDGLTCFGTETCDSDAGWSVCTAKDPVAETCNNADDNCNAVVDDVAGRFDACNIANTHGTCPGALDCRTGAALTCVGQTPAAESCNGIDDDCNGSTDNVVAPLCPKQLGVCAGSRQICAGQLGLLACTIGSYGVDYEVNETRCDNLDNDCDGQTDEVDLDGDRHRPIACDGDDCDDTDRLTFPGNAEICGDAADNDCNGIDDDRDLDGDGWIAAQCGGEDCDDSSDVANPTGTEVCGDGKDNDCDGSADNKDQDVDTFIDRNCGGVDCNDARSDVGPGKPESCDGLDNNCNSQTDEKDADADGFVDAGCLPAGSPVADCDDSRPLVNPDAVEVCLNTLDEDCSGVVNDRDLDGDGVFAAGCLASPSDCNDFDGQTYPAHGAVPGAPEVWDTKDNDCDGEYDEGLISVGDVIVTEAMGDPTGADAVGEWFELTNMAPFAINLRGWKVSSDNDLGFTITGDVIALPGRPVTLCLNGEPTVNGGVTCVYDYQDVQFSNSQTDTLGITFGTTAIDVVNNLAAAGASHSYALKGGSYEDVANDTAGNWCVLPTLTAYDYDGGAAGPNYGTPGVINPSDCSNTPVPAVIAVFPGNGLLAGGETVTLRGSNLTGATSVLFGSPPSSCSVATSGASTITCTTSSHGTSGFVSVTVTATAGTSAALANAYVYTVAGNGPFTSATLSGPLSYTAPADEIGPPISATVAPADSDPLTPPNTTAQLGYGPTGTDPSVTPNWTWFHAAFISGGAVDTFRRALALPTDQPAYAYGYRFSQDGITWRYTTSRGVATITN